MKTVSSLFAAALSLTAAAVDADNCPQPEAATAIEYGLIAALTSNGPDVTETVYAEVEFE